MNKKTIITALLAAMFGLDFERFAERIGLPKKRAASVLDMFMEIPQETLRNEKHVSFDSQNKNIHPIT